MAPVGEVSPVWISLHTTPLPGRFGVGGFGRLGGMYCIVCELPRALSRTPRIEIPPAPKVCPEAFPVKASIRASQEESHGSFKSRVLYAVLPVLPLPASLSFNSARTLRANSIGRNGFSR